MKSFFIIIYILLSSGLMAGVLNNLMFDLESGLIRSDYNDVAIPGDTGTRFSLSEDLKAEDNVFFRLRLNYALSEKSELSLLYAHLKIRSSGEFSQNTIFEGKEFAADSRIRATYVFNSYRITYSYRLWQREKWWFRLGLTAKIRDAEIKLQNDITSAKKANIGFVPIIFFAANYKFSERFDFEISGDALAAPQGRAEDVLFALLYSLSPTMQLKIGYRFLEGGSDIDEVYTFALINYAVIGMKLKF